MTPVMVLDASALLAVALHERGGDVVLGHIRRCGAGILIHAINAFEVVTKLRYRGLSEADAWAVVGFHDVTRVDDIGDDILHTAARIKFSAPSLSLGDCFCLALTEYAGGVCLTSDKGFLSADTAAVVNIFRD